MHGGYSPPYRQSLELSFYSAIVLPQFHFNCFSGPHTIFYILITFAWADTWSNDTTFIQVYEFVGLAELHYAGSHGMDIMGPVRPMSNDHPNCIRSTDKQVMGL